MVDPTGHVSEFISSYWDEYFQYGYYDDFYSVLQREEDLIIIPDGGGTWENDDADDVLLVGTVVESINFVPYEDIAEIGVL